jgi:hypothetical protein
MWASMLRLRCDGRPSQIKVTLAPSSSAWSAWRNSIPDLNPVESLWGDIKGTELSSLCADSLDESTRAGHAGVDRVRSDNDLAFEFLRHCVPLTMIFVTVICEPLFNRRMLGSRASIADYGDREEQ